MKIRLLYEEMSGRYYLYYPIGKDYRLVWGRNGNHYWDDLSHTVAFDKYSEDISIKEFPDKLKKKAITSMFDSEVGVFARR